MKHRNKRRTVKHFQRPARPTVIQTNSLYLYTCEEGHSLMTLMDFVRMILVAVKKGELV